MIDVDTGRAVTTLRPCDRRRAIDRAQQWILVDVDDLCPDRAENGGRTGFVNLDTGESIASADANRVFFAALGSAGSVAEDLVLDIRLRTTWSSGGRRRLSC